MENALTLSELPEPYKEALALHEGLRRLEFTPEQIFFVVGKIDPRRTGLGIEVQRGDKRCLFSVGIIDLDRERAVALWNVAIDLWNNAVDSRSELAAAKIYTESAVTTQARKFVMRLINAGFMEFSQHADA